MVFLIQKNAVRLFFAALYLYSSVWECLKKLNYLTKKRHNCMISELVNNIQGMIKYMLRVVLQKSISCVCVHPISLTHANLTSASGPRQTAHHRPSSLCHHLFWHSLHVQAHVGYLLHVMQKKENNVIQQQAL